MPSLSFASQTQILAALFQGTPLPQAATLYVALHNVNPGGSGTQSTNETSYSGYARVAVPCSPGSWTVSAQDPTQVQNLRPITFPGCTGSADVVAFWSLGYAATGPGQIITSGPVGPGTMYGFSADVADSFFVPLLPPGIVAGQPVILYQFGPGMLIPGGFNEGQIYYVTSVGTESLLLSASPGGPAIGATTAGTGLLLPVTPLNVTLNTVPTFPPSSLLTFMD